MGDGKQSLKELFIEIWSERPHECEGCGAYLPEPAIAHYFSHLNSRGALKKATYDKDNIVLKCVACHYKWDFGARDSIPNSEKLLEKKLEIKRKYNNK